VARQLRIEYKGAFYHITSRGNQRESIFWDDRDRKQFLEILKRTKERYKYFLHAYILMDNHYHLLIETPHGNIKQIMQNINTSYTVFINRRHNRTGHLLQGRYKAFIVDKENYLLELSRYIHLNPVRANMVNRPEEYKWGSYGDYIDKEKRDTLTDRDDTLYHFSKVRGTAIENYKKFVDDGLRESSPFENAKGSILGSADFKDKVGKYLKRRLDEIEIPEVKGIGKVHQAEDIVSLVANYYGVNKGDILKRKRSTYRYRNIAIYLSKLLSGKKNRDIGKMFGITIQGVTNACRRIEKAMEKDDKLKEEIKDIKDTAEKVK